MNQWSSLAKEAWARSSIIVRFFCLYHLTDTYLLSPTHVMGPSMLPTLNLTGDVVLAERLSHRLGRVERGDVVLVQSPLDPKKTLTKRIVAIEGDTVTFSLESAQGHVTRSLLVPKGRVWIHGDNLYSSTDSREFGPVPYGLIRGKVLLRVWPPNCFGSLSQ